MHGRTEQRRRTVVRTNSELFLRGETKMRITGIACMTLLSLLGVWTIGQVPTQARSNDPRVAVLDDCEPTDAAWAPTGGCALKEKDGDVTMSEFGALLFSPLGPGGVLIGHPSWRNEPSHLVVGSGKTVRLTNNGGRGHTFTEVANFGGGFVFPLNGALAPAPECLVPTALMAPGEKADLTGLAPGLHRFQCCIHPWMRATIRVE
jgi:plastocyanin